MITHVYVLLPLLKIKREGVTSYYLDVSDPSCSNWLRFINCARNEEEQNMEAYQYHGEIYYHTFKAIYPGNELMVWYGEKYAEELGISVKYTGIRILIVILYRGTSLLDTLGSEKIICNRDIYLNFLGHNVLLYLE